MNKFKLALFGYSGLLGLAVGVIIALFMGAGRGRSSTFMADTA